MNLSGGLPTSRRGPERLWSGRGAGLSIKHYVLKNYFPFSFPMTQLYGRAAVDNYLDGCKVFDASGTQPLTPLPGWSGTYSLLQIIRGRDDSQRIGREIFVRRMVFRYYIRADDTDIRAALVRVLIFHDKQYRGVVVTPSNLLQALDITAFQNKYNRDRFKFLYDETHTLSVVGQAAPLDNQHLTTPLVEVVLDLDMLITYGTGGAVDIRGNNVAMVIPTVSTVSLTTLFWTCRVFYEDR